MSRVRSTRTPFMHQVPGVLVVLLLVTIIGCGGGDEAEPSPRVQKTATTPAILPIVTPTPGAATTPQPSPEASAHPDDNPAASQETTYTVQAGNTLQSIASEFDLDIAELMEANDISDPAALQEGQVLKVPKPEE